MYKIAVSPEQLDAFAHRIKNFKKAILSECIHLQQQAEAVKTSVDDKTAIALMRPVKEIISIVADSENSLKELTDSAYSYAGMVRNIQQKIEAEKEHRNTFKETACGVACSMIMHEHIQAAGSEYQTMEGYRLEKLKNGLEVADVVLEGIELITGATLKPPMEPITTVLENITDIVDGNIALKHPEKKIDRSVNKQSLKEQIDSHTLIIDNPNSLK